MATVTIASSTTTASVIEGDIMSPLMGVWTADLVIDQPGTSVFTPGTKVTISSENGYSRTGVVDPYRSGSRLDAVYVRILGGAGGMLKASSARSYVQPGAFAKDVINGFVSDSGESLDATTSTAFLGTNLTAWSVIGGNTVARNLKQLIRIVAPTYNWRILANGKLWIGAETWPAASATFDAVDFNPADQSYHIGSESPFIVPGTSISGVGNVSRVFDKIAKGKLRSRVWVDIPGTDRGQTYATQQIALQALPGVDYYATYLCQVQSQSSDLTTVDISPLGARNQSLIGGLQRVPVRFGTGIKIQVTPGSTVLLGWDGGNPASPFAFAGLSGDSALAIKLSDSSGDSVSIGSGSVSMKDSAGDSVSIGTGSASMKDSAGDSVSIGSGSVTIKAANTAQILASSSGVTLGANPLAAPVLTLGAFDSMGVPVTNSPTNTGAVKAG